MSASTDPPANTEFRIRRRRRRTVILVGIALVAMIVVSAVIRDHRATLACQAARSGTARNCWIGTPSIGPRGTVGRGFPMVLNQVWDAPGELRTLVGSQPCAFHQFAL